MNLRDKLKEETIILPIQSTTQSETIQELLVHLQNNKILSATTKLVSYIDNNEKKSPCAAGRGVAYPHSASIEIDKLTCVLGFSPDGIDFTRKPSADAVSDTNETICLSNETGSNLASVRLEQVTPSALQICSINDPIDRSASCNFCSSVLRKSMVINASLAITFIRPGFSFVTPTVPI